jgi:general secretion pathway protein G
VCGEQNVNGVKENKMNTEGLETRRARIRALAAHASTRGVTLTEIMIVLAIIALIGGAVAAGVLPKLAQAKEKATKTDMQTLHGIAEEFRADNSGECPTMESMKAKKLVKETQRNLDGWDHPYTFECEGDEVYVRSWGADGKANTADDLMVPAKKSE